MVFADASALISIIAREPDALALAGRLQEARGRLCSALSAWETVAALCHVYAFPVAAARHRVSLFLGELDFQFVTIGEHEFELAADAFARFGKGRHPARLNMGDCFAYACCKTNGAALLFKGDDFSKTDVVAAT